MSRKFRICALLGNKRLESVATRSKELWQAINTDQLFFFFTEKFLNEEGQKETSCPTPPTGQNLKKNYCSIIFLWLKFPFSSRSKRRLFFTGMGDKVLFLHSFHIILIPFKKKTRSKERITQPFTPFTHQYAYSPYNYSHISHYIDKENLLENQELCLSFPLSSWLKWDRALLTNVNTVNKKKFKKKVVITCHFFFYTRMS